MPLEQAIIDTDRVNYFRGTTTALLAAMNEDGVEIKAYFPWSEYPLDPAYPAPINLALTPTGFLDNFEW